MTEKEFYDWLRTQFTDLPSAKLFIAKWAANEGRMPDTNEPWTVSVRAMAGHCSNVLEGKTQETGYPGKTMIYFDTRYGTALAREAWSNS